MLNPAPLSPIPAPPASFALWLIIPVKSFGEGKSRLANVLSPRLRAEMSRRWLTHVLTTTTAWGHFAGIAVISRDPAVLTLASNMGALPIPEVGDDLNAAVAQASMTVTAAGAEAVLMLPSDLPLLTVADLDALYALALAGEGVVIAPSQDGGTNALLLRPPNAIAYSFGERSAARHMALAEASGLPSQIYNSSTLALDVDYPEDLLLVNS
jgi:2-phospho-L-lactate guanylyltransferase